MNNLYNKLNNYVPIAKETLRELSNIAKIKTFEENECLSRNTAKKQLGFIIDGAIRLYHLSSDGAEFNKTFFIKDDLFMTFLDENNNLSLFTQSLMPCKVILFDYDDFMKLTIKHRSLEQLFNKVLLEYLQKKQQKEIELLSLEAKDRYMKFIKENLTLAQRLAQYHIASYLGITPTQLSRIKKALV